MYDNLTNKIIIQVHPTYHAMIQRNERDQVEARKAFYDNAKGEEDMVEMGEFAGNIRNNLKNISKLRKYSQPKRWFLQ